MFWWICSLINLILAVSKNQFFAGISHALSSFYSDVTIGLVCCNLPVLTVKIASSFTMKLIESSAFEQLSKEVFILPAWAFIYFPLVLWGVTWKKGIFSSLSSYFPPSTAFPTALLYFHLSFITSSRYLLAVSFNNTALASTKVLFNVGDVLQP